MLYHKTYMYFGLSFMLYKWATLLFQETY